MPLLHLLLSLLHFVEFDNSEIDTFYIVSLKSLSADLPSH